MAESQSPASQTCRNCGTVNTTRSKFCKKCGVSLQILEACPQCGNKLDPDADFCQQCGFMVKKQVEIPPSTTLTVRRLPFGLEVLIVFGFLGAAYYFFASMMVIYGANTLFGGSGLSRQLIMVGVFWAFLGLYLATVSLGLWKLKEWARKALMIQAVLVLVGAFFNPIPGLFSFVYCLIILWYIYQPHIKLLFQTAQVSTIATPTATFSITKQVCPSCGAKGKTGTMFCVKCGARLKEVGK